MYIIPGAITGVGIQLAGSHSGCDKLKIPVPEHRPVVMDSLDHAMDRHQEHRLRVAEAVRVEQMVVMLQQSSVEYSSLLFPVYIV